MENILSFFKKTPKIFIKPDKKHKIKDKSPIIINLFWFILGAFLGLFFFLSFLIIFYQKTYNDLIYIGVSVDNKDFSGKTKQDVKKYFALKNNSIESLKLQIQSPSSIATFSARELDFGIDDELLAEQAYSIGRSGNQITDISLILKSYFSGINLPKSYHHEIDKLDKLLSPMKKEVKKDPVNALFTFENNRVSAFTLASDGQMLDMQKLKKDVYDKLVKTSNNSQYSIIRIEAPIKILKPEINNENVNTLGIKEVVGEGTSLFYHSIENRIYNINLAANRLNGILIAPGEVFSFAKALGDVSSFTGYKQAYVIENGRTVLGDGGGVCQVSTTLFRAALNAGLPIIERNPHAYRVSYYELDSGPGVDAAVYVPSVDLKFKNDTKTHLLIQTYIDLQNLSLTFDLYGAKDGREVTVTKPVILSQSPAPEPLYQDDPELPKGVVKQIDFAASGAKVYFKRTVKKDGKTVIDETFNSNYRPWQAVYLRGTKE